MINNHGDEISIAYCTKILYYKEGNYKYFVDKFLSHTYEIFYGKKSTTMPKDLRKFLRLSPEVRIGDWYLFRNHTVIRVYG